MISRIELPIEITLTQVLKLDKKIDEVYKKAVEKLKKEHQEGYRKIKVTV